MPFFPAPSPITPPTPTTPTNTWSISGTVSDTVSSAPIPNAVITPSWDLQPATTGADGTYNLGAVQNPVTISADGYVTRKQWVNWQRGPRTGVSLDLIRNAAPFSMDFYRQFVRGAYDHEEAPYSVLRLPESPTFYVKTVDEQGRPLEPQVLALILDSIRRAVPPYSGGRYTAMIETGTESRPPRAGWINVNILSDPGDEEEDFCGLAYVGRLDGEITLNSDVCSCGSTKIPGRTIMHEVGHALGFFHVEDAGSVMYPTTPGRCPTGEVSDLERFHAAIAYSRPRGNTDPDDDPSTGPRLTPGPGAGPGIRIKN